MELPELNMITDFEILQNPSLFSRVFSLSGIKQFLQSYSFWQWGALIFALVATITALIATTHLSFIRFVKTLDSSVPPIEQFLDDSDSSDSVDSPSTPSSSDEPYSRSTSFSWSDRQTDEDFSVAGSGQRLLRRLCSSGKGFSWSDFAKGNSVVKLWDSLGLDVDLEEDPSESVVSVWDSSASPPSVVFSAGSNDKNIDNVVFSAYDARVGGERPAMRAEWPRWPRGGAGGGDGGFERGGGGGVEKVYVRDDVTGEVTVGDLRKIRSPLEEDSTESDGEYTWWDADAVIGGSDELADH